ncbi:MAG: cytochrome C oxidase subunit II [Chloroflexota bacterium]
MAIYSPERNWWKPLGREEKLWVSIAAVWCVFMFFMLFGWYYLGTQNLPTVARRVTTAQYKTLADAFVTKYKVGEEGATKVPVVDSKGDPEIYLVAQKWQWVPILILESGKKYNLHISSIDVQHGFSLQPININLQILPGYDFIVEFTPTTKGEYSLICNEFCSIGHHLMTGRIVVK